MAQLTTAAALPRGTALRRDAGLYGIERAVARAGFTPVAGVDEAGRGACAGPLVAAAVILDQARPTPGLTDSKLLTPAARDRIYQHLVERALAWSVVVVEPAEIDHHGVHECNLRALRQAAARLGIRPGYLLSDGFAVPGTGLPGLAVWKGDQVAACVAAASVVAKVTRDRIMVELDRRHPQYGFAVHKGYVTGAHQRALTEYGACPQHRFSYANVARLGGGERSVPAQSATPGGSGLRHNGSGRPATTQVQAGQRAALGKEARA